MEEYDFVDEDAAEDLLEAFPRRQRNKDQKKKSDPGFHFLMTQITVCLLALLTAFVFKFIGGGTFQYIKTKYIAMFEDKTSTTEVLQTIGKAFVLSGPASGTSSAGGKSPSTVATSTAPKTTSTPSASVSSNVTSPAATSAAPDPADTLNAANMAVSANINSMIWPVSGKVTSDFGLRIHPIIGTLLMHYGLDIAANYGDDVRAALGGTVKESGPSDAYGNYVILSHGNGLETLYAHNSKLLVKAGDTVKKGDVISQVGSSGESTGPHCHFEVRINGVCIDPLWALPARSA